MEDRVDGIPRNWKRIDSTTSLGHTARKLFSPFSTADGSSFNIEEDEKSVFGCFWEGGNGGKKFSPFFFSLFRASHMKNFLLADCFYPHFAKKISVSSSRTLWP